jgi:hypothetical protein
MAKRIGTITVGVSVNTDGMDKGVRKAKQRLKDFEKSVKDTGKLTTALGGGALGGRLGQLGDIAGVFGAGGMAGGGKLVGLAAAVTTITGAARALQTAGEFQMRAAEALKAGKTADEMLKEKLIPSLVGAMARNATPGGAIGFSDAFSNTLAATSGSGPGTVGGYLRNVGGFWGSILGDIFSGRGSFMWQRAGTLGAIAENADSNINVGALPFLEHMRVPRYLAEQQQIRRRSGS